MSLANFTETGLTECISLEGVLSLIFFGIKPLLSTQQVTLKCASSPQSPSGTGIVRLRPLSGHFSEALAYPASGILKAAVLGAFWGIKKGWGWKQSELRLREND